jgi:hypothetical protein
MRGKLYSPTTIRALLLALVFLSAIALVNVNRQAKAAPPNFQNQAVIVSGLTLPTAMEFLPDDRLPITEFKGAVKLTLVYL